MNMEESFGMRTSRACAYLLEKYRWMMDSAPSGTVPAKASWLSDSEIEQVLAAHKKGYTVSQIANVVGRSFPTVKRCLVERGIKPNPLRAVTVEEMKLMWEMKQKGSSMIDILRVTGLAEKTIHNYIKKYEREIKA